MSTHRASRSTLFFVLLMLQTVAGVQAMDTETAEVLLSRHIEPAFEPGNPGCVAGIARDGRLLAAGAYGMANIELGVAMKTNMVFDIGSASKQFTAASIALLSQRGQVDLDADIRRYLDDMPVFDEPIRVRDLVYHSSGLPDVYESLEWISGNRDGNKFRSELTLKMARGMSKLEFAPGSQYEYSNLGYLLLGEIVEKVSGQTLRQFAHENFFEPMEMSNTHFHDDIGELVPNRASAYSLAEDGRTWRWRHSDFDVMGDGGVYSTLEDLAKWYNVYKDPTRLEGGKELVELLLTVGEYTDSAPEYLGMPLNYGFGVQLLDRNGSRLIGHPGGWAGYGTIPYYFPDADVAAITLCNVVDRALFGAYMNMADDIMQEDDND